MWEAQTIKPILKFPYTTCRFVFQSDIRNYMVHGVLNRPQGCSSRESVDFKLYKRDGLLARSSKLCVCAIILSVAAGRNKIDITLKPVTVAEQSNTCTVFARNSGSWVRIPLRASMFSVCVRVCVFLCLCTGRGLATSWSPAQGVLPTV
jgi:hypothetical protein